jgi:hypothetical protein
MYIVPKFMADSVTQIKRRHRVEAKRLRGECRYCHRPSAPYTRCELHRRKAVYWKDQYGSDLREAAR